MIQDPGRVIEQVEHVTPLEHVRRDRHPCPEVSDHRWCETEEPVARVQPVALALVLLVHTLGRVRSEVGVKEVLTGDRLDEVILASNAR